MINNMHEQTIGYALKQMQENKQLQKLVHNWRELIPADSHWEPGMPGDPGCKTCGGTGYIRIEGLSISHPYFGKVYLCECVKPDALKRAQQHNAKASAKVAAERKEQQAQLPDPAEVTPDPPEPPEWMSRKDIE